jgi:hypothetical protein
MKLIILWGKKNIFYSAFNYKISRIINIDLSTQRLLDKTTMMSVQNLFFLGHSCGKISIILLNLMVSNVLV